MRSLMERQFTTCRKLGKHRMFGTAEPAPTNSYKGYSAYRSI